MFYISSQGHSATAWLSRSLNVHPNIVCWHGSRSLPPYATNDQYYRNFSVKEFVSGLQSCEKNTFGQKVFGATHGFYGIAIKQEIEKKGGNFFAIFRHPYAKINSIFSAYYPYKLTKGIIGTDEIKLDYSNFFTEFSEKINQKCFDLENKKKKKEKIKYLLRKSNLLAHAKIINKYFIKYKNKLKIKQKNLIKKDTIDINSYPDNKKVDSAIDTFMHACIRTFETDLELINNCSFDQILQMEEFTSSKKKFNMILKKVTGFEMNSKQLEQVFKNKNHINIHSVKKNINEIYKTWPDGFKNIIQQYLLNKKLKRFYNKLNYIID